VIDTKLPRAHAGPPALAAAPSLES
jgi:hypothetical protein